MNGNGSGDGGGRKRVRYLKRGAVGGSLLRNTKTPSPSCGGVDDKGRSGRS